MDSPLSPVVKPALHMAPGGGAGERLLMRRMNRTCLRHLHVLASSALLLAGCQSSPVLSSQYISPRVKGRVLDAATGQPIRNVSIRRLESGQNPGTTAPAKGAQPLERMQALRTDPNGGFNMDSERDLMLLRRSDWYSVTLAFTHAHYQRLTTNYTLANAIISPGGEPVVDAGNILLQPSSGRVTIR